MYEAAAWAPHALRKLAESDVLGSRGAQFLLQYSEGRTITLSKAFFGVLTPELGARLWVNALSSFNSGSSPRRPMTFELLFAIEWNTACQEEILNSLPADIVPTCLFGDQLGFIPQDVATAVADQSREPSWVRRALLDCMTLPRCWCLRHGRSCEARTADVNIAGTCTDHSTMNYQLSGMDGSKNRFYWAWVRHRRAHLQAVFIHENVVAFGVHQLEQDSVKMGSVVCLLLFSGVLHMHRFILLS